MQRLEQIEADAIQDATVQNMIARVLSDLPDTDEASLKVHLTFHRAHAVYAAALSTRYAALSISVGRFNLLKLIYQNDPKRLTVSEVAAHLDISVPSTLRMVQIVESEGWLQTTKGEADRRVTLVEFTDEGRRRFAALLPPAVDIWEELWEGFNADEKALLTRLLLRLRQGLLKRYIGEEGLAAFRAAQRYAAEQTDGASSPSK